MCVISNIELDIYNKKCEINNRGERKMKTQENHLITLAGTLIALGIIFGSDRLIGYPLIGAGVLTSILYWIRSKNRGESH